MNGKKIREKPFMFIMSLCSLKGIRERFAVMTTMVVLSMLISLPLKTPFGR